jgi:hypothetical protein
MPRWRRNSIFGLGPRVPLDREQHSQFRAKLLLQRRPGRLTLAAVQIGRIMLDMLGADGQLDPSVATLAIRTAVHPSTVTRALARLKECAFLTGHVGCAAIRVLAGAASRPVMPTYCACPPATRNLRQQPIL